VVGGRKRTWWFDEVRGPMVGHADISGEWDDPTFDAVSAQEEAEPEDTKIPLWILTPEERFVVERAWGIGGDRRVYDFRELGAVFGSRATAHRRYQSAMRKLSEWFESQ
jgi:hypothetical protein